MNTVRTRFAPSPTGLLHVGAVRTALFAWLVARHHNGVFVLRIEDTDKNREFAHAETHILKTLRTLDIAYDEGPDTSTQPYGPYRQSERLEIYHHWAQKLITEGRAYADPYTSEELKNFRNAAQKNKQPFLFREHRPANPPQWDGSQPLRFKSGPKTYRWKDEVMGALSTGPEVIDDFVLIKPDGYPTYNFAHIIDDAEMHITHVIRGQEFISSMPNYLNLYEALSLDIPIFATMPAILGPDGKRKLSKRDNAKDVLDYVKQGFPKEALISFIATLGWNDGTTQELFTREELIKKFSLNRVGKSGAVFDDKRLLWTSGNFIRRMDSDNLYSAGKQYLPEESKTCTENYNKKVLQATQERIKYFSELPDLTYFFYREPDVDLSLIHNHKKLKHYSKAHLVTLLIASASELKKSTFTIDSLNATLQTLLASQKETPAALFSLIRIATSQSTASPGLSETLAILGKERVLSRIQQQITALQSK